MLAAFIFTVAFGAISRASSVSATTQCGLFSCYAFQVSNGGGNTTSPTVATSGQYVYVTWDQSLDSVYARVNTDYGSPTAWRNATLLSQYIGGVGEVVMSVNGSNVYVAWSQVLGQSDQIEFVSSNNYGQTFSKPIDVPGILGLQNQQTITPVIASWGQTVYLAWDDDSGPQDGSWVTASSNGGATWQPAFQVSVHQHEPQLAATANYGYFVGDGSAFAYTSNAGATWNIELKGAGFGGAGSEPWIAASGPNVYLTSEMKNSTGQGVIKLWYSHNNGQSFNETIVSGNITNDWEPQIAAEGNDVFLAFRTLGDLNVTPPETISAYMTSSFNAGVNWSKPQILSMPGHLTGWPLTVSLRGPDVYTIFGSMTTSLGDTMNAYAAYSNNYGGYFTRVDVSNNNVGVAAPPTDIESASIAASSNGTSAYAVWQQSPTPYNLNSTSKYAGSASWQVFFNGPVENPIPTTTTTSGTSTTTTTGGSGITTGTGTLTIVSKSPTVQTVSQTTSQATAVHGGTTTITSYAPPPVSTSSSSAPGVGRRSVTGLTNEIAVIMIASVLILGASLAVIRRGGFSQVVKSTREALSKRLASKPPAKSNGVPENT